MFIPPSVAAGFHARRNLQVLQSANTSHHPCWYCRYCIAIAVMKITNEIVSAEEIVAPRRGGVTAIVAREARDRYALCIFIPIYTCVSADLQA